MKNIFLISVRNVVVDKFVILEQNAEGFEELQSVPPDALALCEWMWMGARRKGQHNHLEAVPKIKADILIGAQMVRKVWIIQT